MMSFLPVFLLSDILLYILFICIVVFIVMIRRSPQMRHTWRKVLYHPFGAASLVILLAYVIIGMLDSIHYRPALSTPLNGKVYYSTDVKSLLDAIISPLGAEQEKSYSAPFATTLFTKEFMTPNDEGAGLRSNPPLAFANLKHQYPWDIFDGILKAIVFALIVWLILCAILIGYVQKIQSASATIVIKKMMKGQAIAPFRSMLLTVLLVLFTFFFALFLSTKYHILGTDKVGTDVFYASIKSIRTGLLIGSLTTLIMIPFAIILGTLAGFFGGWVDDLVQYAYMTLSAIPGVLLIAASVLSIQVYIDNHPQVFQTNAVRADARLIALCIILGITSWTSLCRVLRGETFKLREMDYIQAARALGTSWMRIIYRHVIPNIFHLVIITMVLEFSALVLAEAILTYVGVGVDPTTFSWGNIIDSGRLELAREPIVWWPLFSAFIFMFIFVLAANIFADVVQDAFDPKYQTLL